MRPPGSRSLASIYAACPQHLLGNGGAAVSGLGERRAHAGDAPVRQGADSIVRAVGSASGRLGR